MRDGGGAQRSLPHAPDPHHGALGAESIHTHFAKVKTQDFNILCFTIFKLNVSHRRLLVMRRPHYDLDKHR